MMQQRGHEPIEHTADLAIRVWAPDLRGLVEEAALGMIDLMVENPPAATRTVERQCQAETPEDLLVECLREVLLLIELEGLVPVDVDVAMDDEATARLQVHVVPVSEAGDSLTGSIKAVTYHNLEVRETDRGLEVEIVFDV